MRILKIKYFQILLPLPLILSIFFDTFISLKKIVTIFFKSTLSGTDIDPVNKDDSLEMLLSQNLVGDDSFDDLISQTEETEYRKDDSLDEFITQSDEIRAEQEHLKANPSTPKSKVTDWLAKAKPNPINENSKFVRREKTHSPKSFEVSKNLDMTGCIANLNWQAKQRQEYLFKLLSKEQDLDQQKLDLFKKRQL